MMPFILELYYFDLKVAMKGAKFIYLSLVYQEFYQARQHSSVGISYESKSKSWLEV
jgi:hypothetical protein